jgi:xanthine dehydrogenase iron-sulfur cluster and FAD-binding subunit A
MIVLDSSQPGEEEEHLSAGEDLDDGVELRAVADLRKELAPVADQAAAQQVSVAGAQDLVTRQHPEQQRNKLSKTRIYRKTRLFVSAMFY